MKRATALALLLSALAALSGAQRCHVKNWDTARKFCAKSCPKCFPSKQCKSMRYEYCGEGRRLAIFEIDPDTYNPNTDFGGDILKKNPGIDRETDLEGGSFDGEIFNKNRGIDRETDTGGGSSNLDGLTRLPSKKPTKRPTYPPTYGGAWKRCSKVRICPPPTPKPTKQPTNAPTFRPTTRMPTTTSPTTSQARTSAPTTAQPTTKNPTTGAPTALDCALEGYCYVPPSEWCVPCEGTAQDSKGNAQDSVVVVVVKTGKRRKGFKVKNICASENPCKPHEVCAYEERGADEYTFACLSAGAPKVEDFSDTGAAAGTVAAISVVISGGVAVAASATASAGASVSASASAASASTGASSTTTTNVGDVLTLAQGLVLGAQMNLPFEPADFYDFASSFGWSTFNIGVASWFEKDGSNSNTRRRLSSATNSTSGTRYGIDRYCDTLGIDPQYFMLDVLGGCLVFACVVFSTMFLLRRVVRLAQKGKDGKGGASKWLAKKISVKLQDTLLRKLAYGRMVVRAVYYSFYPVAIATMFQFQFTKSLQGSDARLASAQRLSILAAFIIVAYLVSILCFVYASVLKNRRVSEKNDSDRKTKVMIKRLSTKFGESAKEILEKPLGALEDDYKQGCKSFWVLKLARHLLTAIAVSSIVDPRPSQPCVILGVALLYLASSIFFRPYTNIVSNTAVIIYASLAVLNSAIFVLYGMSTSSIRRSTLRTLGKVQVGVNFLMLLGIMFVVLGRSSGAHTCADFKSWILLEKYYPKIPGYYKKRPKSPSFDVELTIDGNGNENETDEEEVAALEQ